TGLAGMAVKNVPCTAGGNRRSVIGTGEEVKYVLNSNNGAPFAGTDGIGYAFFSYGNVDSIANNSNYGYLTIDGVDPIFQIYGANGIDQGQPLTDGVLPRQANLPGTCAGGAGAFPCHEKNIWKGGLSFPHLRDGTYRQWCVIRIISDGVAFTNAQALVAAAQNSVVTKVPDFVPAAQVVAGTFTDPGLQVYRSHYTQSGVSPVNNQNQGVTPLDRGGEEGGCIVPKGSVATSLVQRNTGCLLGN